jgi:phosphoheptose isomerase
MSATLQRALTDAAATFRSLENLSQPVEKAADLIAQSLTGGHQVLACGNGGSAADAADFTTEFTCRFTHDRRPYPAINLSQGGSLLTATGNDYSFEEVFSRPLRAYAKPGDTLVAISTSGNSKNIRRALDQAKSSGISSIALLGRDGGVCRKVADVDLIVGGNATARIQEAHKFLLHVICEIVETRLSRE